ncbi:MAG: response regulator [Candidatus Thorarchaeota archaeon]|jgi:CheY-like chemotaxis protein|nr:response regulator [Candidatus Thorarchaeota archaeon]
MKIDKRGPEHIDSAIVGELTHDDLHSFNNLLQGIIGLSELLNCNPDLPPDARTDSKVILEMAQNASDLIKRIRQASRVEDAESETRVVEVTPDVEVPKPKSRSDVNILIVDDDPLVLKVVAGMLKAVGYSTITAQDGLEALEKYKENPDKVSLVLSDLAMPRMSGLQLAEELLADNPNLKIIIMSGYMQEEPEIDPDEFGLAAWLEKPMTAARLTAAIQPIVGV